MADTTIKVVPKGSGTHTTVKQGDRLLYSGPSDGAAKFLKDHNKR